MISIWNKDRDLDQGKWKEKVSNWRLSTNKTNKLKKYKCNKGGNANC